MTAMSVRRKPSPAVRAATPSGWRARQKRLTPPNLLWKVGLLLTQ
jgi:hypothetical protein